MTGLARTTLEGAETFKAQKFRMKVTLREVVFGSGSYFNNLKLEIASSTGPFTFFAQNHNNILVFENGHFHFGSSNENEALAMSARCDKF